VTYSQGDSIQPCNVINMMAHNGSLAFIEMQVFFLLDIMCFTERNKKTDSFQSLGGVSGRKVGVQFTPRQKKTP
jgi:hypothetical protein